MLALKRVLFLTVLLNLLNLNMVMGSVAPPTPEDPIALEKPAPQTTPTSSLTRPEFIEKVKEYALRYGSNKFTLNVGGTNYGTKVVVDERKVPFAVLKSGRRTKKEAFISEYAEKMGLGSSVAKSFVVENLAIKDEQPFSGLVEEWVRHGVTENHPLHLKSLTDSVGVQHTMVINLMLEKEIDWAEYFDVDSVHRAFLTILLTYGQDSHYGNVMARVNSNNKLDFVLMDTEQFFSGVVKSFIYHMPFGNTPLSKENREIVLNWTEEKRLPFKGEINNMSPGLFETQTAMVKNLQEYLRINEKATPIDIMLFAFFNQKSDNYEPPMLFDLFLAQDVERKRLFKSNQTEEIDRFFKLYSQSSHPLRSLKHVIEDFKSDKTIKKDGTYREKIKNFFNFVLIHKEPGLKEEMKEGFKIYIKKLLNIDITGDVVRVEVVEKTSKAVPEVKYPAPDLLKAKQDESINK